MALPVSRASSPMGRSRAPARPDAQALGDQLQPFREIDDLHTRMEQLLQGIWSDARLAQVAPAVFVPPVDIEETDDAWVVEAELPGVDKKDVNIDVNDSELRISGEIKERERKGILRRRTRRVGEFEYRVILPGDVDPDSVDASLDGGILTLRIPKPQQSQPRRIDVRSGGDGGEPS